MANEKEFKNNKAKSKFTNSFKDLVVIIAIFIIVFVLSYFFDVFIFLIDLLKKYPKLITYVDEIFTSLLTLSIGFAVFSWRRWIELKKETAERIKLQEELIKIADTKAETERIISKQLHTEIELRKQKERPPSK